MRDFRVSFPELWFVGGTRGLLGAGVGLLLAGQLPQRRRRQLGLSLLIFGVLTTIPIIATAVRRRAGANGHARKGAEQPAFTG